MAVFEKAPRAFSTGLEAGLGERQDAEGELGRQTILRLLQSEVRQLLDSLQSVPHGVDVHPERFRRQGKARVSFQIGAQSLDQRAVLLAVVDQFGQGQPTELKRLIAGGGADDQPIGAEAGAVRNDFFAPGAQLRGELAQLSFADWQNSIGCGGVVVFPDDAIVADQDGAVVIPKSMIGDVINIATEAQFLEDWIMLKVMEGRKLPGLYTPSEETALEYVRERRCNPAS